MAVNINQWEIWADALNERITQWLKSEATKDFHCKRCSAQLKQRTVYCSIHEAFGLLKTHAGGGKVHTFVIPECPTESCVNHRPSYWDKELRIDENNHTMYGPCIDY